MRASEDVWFMRVCVLRVCVFACMRVCVYRCMHVYAHVCMRVCVFACMRVCVYAYMRVCVFACMRVRDSLSDVLNNCTNASAHLLALGSTTHYSTSFHPIIDHPITLSSYHSVHNIAVYSAAHNSSITSYHITMYITSYPITSQCTVHPITVRIIVHRCIITRNSGDEIRVRMKFPESLRMNFGGKEVHRTQGAKAPISSSSRLQEASSSGRSHI
jgi:hypothetical protein